jgi:hypothetical protein
VVGPRRAARSRNRPRGSSEIDRGPVPAPIAFSAAGPGPDALRSPREALRRREHRPPPATTQNGRARSPRHAWGGPALRRQGRIRPRPRAVRRQPVAA